MKTPVAIAAALAATLAWSAPADAHIVYFKDGTVVRGEAVIKEASVTVKGAGAELTFPLASVRAISFTDEPIGYEQLRENPSPGGDVLAWTAVAANVVAVVVAVATLMR